VAVVGHDIDAIVASKPLVGVVADMHGRLVRRRVAELHNHPVREVDRVMRVGEAVPASMHA